MQALAADANVKPLSILTPVGTSYYAVTNYLDVEHYQELVDRGWRREKVRQRTEFDLVETVHESEYDRVPKPPEPEHRFEVTLEPDTFTEEKYKLYANYQRVVHHDTPSEITRTGFKRFLCGSPLQRTSRNLNGKTQCLGSFHQCYRLDGRLIAMGVLDLLPHCVSGVYLIYHEDFEKWSFGKLSALREAALALEAGYEFYYMGYYIHPCTKMRYKGEYKPQHVLDPETNEWNLLEPEIRQLLDKKKFVSLSREQRFNDAAPGTNESEKVDSVDLDRPDIDGYQYATPKEAAEAADSGLSLFSFRMPGIMTLEEVTTQIDLGKISISLGGASRGISG
ncbi:Arginyl-tRNA--protein transferase 1 [Coniosporium apollinis]|uniref:Arginyl-tRNA--protein transferase 1 n=1 Tax=Coniosporium apollinis TaxID=61459 RepID=A0ABQ9NY90_9PEZI|nr:Arginyl-tRNA--protein transferase 1 [Coniosporium apollinis]